MRSTTRITVALGLAAFTIASAQPAHAQDGPGHAHVGHVADGFRGTPEGAGLLPTAMMEAEVAASHAGYAIRDLTNLDGMKGHAGHVLNALDPAQMENGPGKGFGVLPAARGVIQHIELAAKADGASDGLKLHSNHVATAARNTVQRAERMVELAKGIAAATTAAAAAPMAQELAHLGMMLKDGMDANEDGRVGWQEGEGGLDAAATHLGLLKRGEGIG